MAILNLGNLPGDFGLPASALSTSATGRDSAYSPSSILCNFQNIIIPMDATAGTDFWFHWRHHMNNVGTGNSSGSGTVLRITDRNGNIVFDIQKTTTASYTFAIRILGSTNVQSGTTFQLFNSTTYTFDLKLVIPASGGTLVAEWYINGTLHSTVSATNSGTVKVRPRNLINDMPSFINGGSTGINFSEIIVAEGESTIGARLATLEPSSAGNYAQWDGTIAALADGETASGISSRTVGHRFNSIMSAYGGAGSPATVRGLFLKANANQAGASAPTQLNQSLRIGGVDYDGSAKAIVPGMGVIHEWANNPATSAPWATAAWAALEAGVLAAA